MKDDRLPGWEIKTCYFGPQHKWGVAIHRALSDGGNERHAVVGASIGECMNSLVEKVSAPRGNWREEIKELDHATC